MGAYLLGIGVALAAATAYCFGVLLQSLEARDVPDSESLKLSLLKNLVSRRRWVLGTACVILGWLLQAAALGLAPLTVVQPALAVGLFVLLIAGERMSDERIGRREVLAVLAIAAGVAGLGLASPKGAEGGSAAATVIGPALAVFAVLALAPYLLKGRKLPILVVISAGLAYACSGFMTKFVADAFSDQHFVSRAGLARRHHRGRGHRAGQRDDRAAEALGGPGVPRGAGDSDRAGRADGPVLAGEPWSTDPLKLAALGVSLVVLAAGTAVLASAGAVAAVVDTDDDDGLLPNRLGGLHPSPLRRCQQQPPDLRKRRKRNPAHHQQADDDHHREGEPARRRRSRRGRTRSAPRVESTGR